MFSWIPIHREAIHRILEYRTKEEELLVILREMEQKGLKVISLQDKDADGKTIPLAEIDPFTFLATFNRGVTDKNRRENWSFLKARWGLKAHVPDDFDGIPTLFNLASWLFPYAGKRKKDHVARLWEIAALAEEGGIEKVGEDLFDQYLKLKNVGIASLTIGLFWINPAKYLAVDHKTIAYGKSKGITTEPKDFQSYRQWLKEMTEKVGNNYPQVSQDAHLFATQDWSQLELTSDQLQKLWERFHERFKDFKDFQNPGEYFVKQETGYKREALEKFSKELGSGRLAQFLDEGKGIYVQDQIARLLTAHLVSLYAWRPTLGDTDKVICEVLQQCLKVVSSPYIGATSTNDLFKTCEQNNLKPNWDALSTLLWALRPQDYFPIKISYFRKLGEELGFDLPSGRPDADKLHRMIGFGRAFYKALEPQKPADWVDVQSFIWCVCPGNYEGIQREDPSPQYWTFSVGTGGDHWEEFYNLGIAAIGLDGTPDLRQLKDKEEIRQKIMEIEPGQSSKKNDALACWQFVHDIKIGDIIFAKQGSAKLLGYGIVEGDYDFDVKRMHFRHVRKVKWLRKGQWEIPGDDKMALKTLTNITPYADFVKSIIDIVGLEIDAELGRRVDPTPPGSKIAYWWLNANPKIWKFEDLPIGQKQTYTSYNDSGNKRQKYRYFQEVKPGDLVVGYVTTPQKEVVAVCKITNGLHPAENREEIEFEKVEDLSKPISYETLQANPDLANCEPLINNQGSLFKLTETEYEIIRSLIDETNIPDRTEIEIFSKKKAFKGLFLEEAQFDEMLVALKEKKNVVLQGAPGVGKTYVAKRLAYALIGSNNPTQIEMIQFHQSYSYEDFIQGFRPTPKGHFELRYGIFYHFCRRAQRDEAHPYVFIIDEINRGNLSKIFGELMMLIEPDKRGDEHAIPLSYSQDPDERFYIPENLHLIGTMNTADRSLAMVDYALRRRFRFITLRPEFSSEAFRLFLAEFGAKSELVKKIITRMNALNEVIAADIKNLGPGYQIGHSYFCPQSGIKPEDDWYRRVIESEIVPLIHEYWFDNEQKVKEQKSMLLA